MADADACAIPQRGSAPLLRGYSALDDLNSKTGEFVRKQAQFREWIKADGSTRFAPEAGRYHLYISLACPWASRCYLYRKLKGLEDVIGLSIVAPVWASVGDGDRKGWVFATESEVRNTIPDTVNGCRSIFELYHLCNRHYSGRYTVPVLWDKKLKTIVSNESSEIIRMLDLEFQKLAKHADAVFYPEPLRAKIDELNAWIYDDINNGVYKTGFATSQAAYELAYKSLFNALDRVEAILDKSRYLTGDQFTEADIRLFMTLIRFDIVYYGHFKCNRQRIADFPNLSNYVRDVYQLPGVAATVDLWHAKHHYYGSHPQINPTGIVPLGPEVDYNRPHNRESRFPKKDV